jgi:hypothetical protein
MYALIACRGRVMIGLYALYLVKWLDHFPLAQLMVVRLEDMDADPIAYLRPVFQHLGLREPTPEEWARITVRLTSFIPFNDELTL